MPLKSQGGISEIHSCSHSHASLQETCSVTKILVFRGESLSKGGQKKLTEERLLLSVLHVSPEVLAGPRFAPLTSWSCESNSEATPCSLERPSDIDVFLHYNFLMSYALWCIVQPTLPWLASCYNWRRETKESLRNHLPGCEWGRW